MRHCSTSSLEPNNGAKKREEERNVQRKVRVCGVDIAVGGGARVWVVIWRQREREIPKKGLEPYVLIILPNKQSQTVLRYSECIVVVAPSIQSLSSLSFLFLRFCKCSSAESSSFPLLCLPVGVSPRRMG